MQLISNDRPIVFASTAHIAELSVMLRLAQSYAIKHPNWSIVFVSTDEAEKKIKEFNNLSNLSFRSYGESSTFDAEFTKHCSQFYKNGATPYPLMDMMVYIEKVQPIKQMILNAIAVMRDLNPILAVINSSSLAASDACVHLGIEYVLVSPTFASSGFFEDYAAAALCVGHPYSGTNAYKPTLKSVITSWWHFKTYVPYAIYMIVVRGMLKDRVALEKEIGTNLMETDNFRVARAVITACNWGIEYPVRFRPNAYLVGPIMSDENLTGKTLAPNDVELIRWIESDTRKVIFISLGSLFVMEKWEIAEFIEQLQMTIESHHVKVIWKFHKFSHDSINEVICRRKLSDADMKIISWVDDIIGLLGHPSIVVNINHAGGNSFNEALYLGVPQLWIPLWIDCFDLGVRGDQIEIGINVICKKSYSGVAPALKRLLTEDKFKRNAMFWAEKCRLDGGREKSIEIIEKIVNDVELEEKYGINHKLMNERTNKVIKDPPFVGRIFFVIKLLAFAVVFGLGWKMGRKNL
ncbi:hypothetical protein HK098_001016 [Nowakowskiella sp. JEL0407]|nr:hypothetical protein HK098_001016 [Nowakowskiella sp. JEL0407]